MQKFASRSTSRRGAVVLSPFGGGTMVGAVGSIVFARHSAGNVARSRRRPVDPATPRQRPVRQRFQAASAAWNALTDTQRASWISYARSTPMDIKGRTIRLPGRAQFMRSSMTAQLVGFAADAYPTAPKTPGILHAPTLLWQLNHGAGFNSVLFMGAVLPIPFPARSYVTLSRNLAPSKIAWGNQFDYSAVLTEGSVPPVIIQNLIPGGPNDIFFVRWRTIENNTGRVSVDMTQRLT